MEIVFFCSLVLLSMISLRTIWGKIVGDANDKFMCVYQGSIDLAQASFLDRYGTTVKII